MPKFVEDNEVGDSPVVEISAEHEGRTNGSNSTENDTKTEEGENVELDPDDFRKRKSLQTQLANRRLFLYREKKRKMEKQNSSFKMRKDTREFYGKLNQEKNAKKAAEREIYERELEEFRRRKQKKEYEENMKQREKEQIEQIEHTDTFGTLETHNDTKTKSGTSTDSSAKTILVSYSDSDSDSNSD